MATINEMVRRNYDKPIDFLSFYKDFHKFNRGNNEEFYTIDNYDFGGSDDTYLDTHRFRGSIPFFYSKDFIKLCRVYRVYVKKESSSGKSHHFSYDTHHFLYCKGHRVHDEYIMSLLPDSVLNSESYRDDSPSFSSSTYIQANLDYLETGRLFERYDLVAHCNYLSDRLAEEAIEFEYQLGRAEKQVVYHEFGHIFGFYLSQKLKYDFGRIAKIELTNNRGGITLADNPYRHSLGLSPEEEARERQQIIQRMERDRKQLLAYFLYILSGAVFNILYFKRKPTLRDFNDVFLSNESLYGEKREWYGSYKGMAGNDFNYISNLKLDLSWREYDFDKFKSMAYELFYILDKHSVFGCFWRNQLYWQRSPFFSNLKPLIRYFLPNSPTTTAPAPAPVSFSVIDAFEQVFSGFVTDDTSKIDSLLGLIDEMVGARIDNLLAEVNWLLDKYILDISTDILYCKTSIQNQT